MLTDQPRYYALRVCPDADADRWWSAARAATGAAPDAIRALLAGRTRIELSAHEATEALEWAQDRDGWDPETVPPILIHPRAPASG